MTPKRLALLLCLFVLYGACSFWRQPTRAEITALREKIESAGEDEWWNISRNLYRDREFRPLWIARGRTLPRLEQFFQLVDDRSHGLHPDEFEVDALRQTTPDLIEFDLRVTHTLVRYASALAFGQVAAADIDRNWIAAKRDVDIGQEITGAIDSDSIVNLAGRLVPRHRQYAQLRNALQTASEEERQQIELNLERWRWLPDDLGDHHIRVNVPSFELQVYEGNNVPLSMRVVVGTNEDRTPIFSSDMKFVVFSPYWNIPESIMTKEMLPKIQKDPDYAPRQDIEVVRVHRGRVEVIDAADVDWDDVSGTDIQLRQKPGSRNSLGLVKFMFPNRFNVYLHDTPSGNLFDRLTRNFSHGCIRVEKPFELASYLLREQPEWTSERIEKAMHAGQEKHVKLNATVPVHILYFTAWIDTGGAIHLEKDIYGYDARHLELKSGDRSP